MRAAALPLTLRLALVWEAVLFWCHFCPGGSGLAPVVCQAAVQPGAQECDSEHAMLLLQQQQLFWAAKEWQPAACWVQTGPMLNRQQQARCRCLTTRTHHILALGSAAELTCTGVWLGCPGTCLPRQLHDMRPGRPACVWSAPFQMPLCTAHTPVLHAPGRSVPSCHSALLQVGHMLQLLGQPRDVLELSYCLGPPSEGSTRGSIAGSRLPAAQPSEAGRTASGAAAEVAATPQRLAAPHLAPAQGAVLPIEAAACPGAHPQRPAAPLLAPAAPPPSLTTRRQSHLPEALPELTLEDGSMPHAAEAGPEADAQECCAAACGRIPPRAAGSQQNSRPGPGQLQGSGAQQQQGQGALLAPETVHMSPLMKQQSELLDALPDMELGMDLDAAAEGPAAAAAPYGAAAAAEASSDALAERGAARGRQGWQAPADRGGAVAMQLSFGHAGGSRGDPAAQHAQGAVGPAEGSQPAASQGTGGAGGQGSAGGGFCFARSPLQPRVATQVSSPARDLVPRDRRPKRKRSARRLLGSGPGQEMLGNEVEQVGGGLHSRCPSMQFAVVLELGLCHGLPLAAFCGAGRWLHLSRGKVLSEMCCRLIVNAAHSLRLEDSPACRWCAPPPCCVTALARTWCSRDLEGRQSLYSHSVSLMQAPPSICSPDESVSSKRCKLHGTSGPSGGDLSCRGPPKAGGKLPSPMSRAAAPPSKASAAAESTPLDSGNAGAAQGDAGTAAQPQQDPAHQADASGRPAGRKGGLAEAPALPAEAGDPPHPPDRWPATKMRTRRARQKQSSRQQEPAGGQQGASDGPAARPRSATDEQAGSLPAGPGRGSSPDVGASEDTRAPALGGNGSIMPSRAGSPPRAPHPHHQELVGPVAPSERWQANPGSAMQPDAGDAAAAADVVEQGVRQRACLVPSPPSAECTPCPRPCLGICASG